MGEIPQTASIELVTVEGKTYMATVAAGPSGVTLNNVVSVTSPMTRRSAGGFVKHVFTGKARTISLGDGKTVMREKLTDEQASWVEQARVALGFAEKSAVPGLIAGEFDRYYTY